MEHPAIHYFEVPDTPGRYFNCARYGMLSIQSCARNFSEAPNRIKEGRYAGCIGCAIGRGHAGDGDAAATACAQKPRRVCVRCRRNGMEDNSRFFGRMRLVREHTVCISCYNREREVAHGRNAKGTQPLKWGGLYHAQMSYLKDGQVHARISTKNPVRDRIEVALTALRQHGANAVFFTAPPIMQTEIRSNL
jgi:hypothetical protein